MLGSFGFLFLFILFFPRFEIKNSTGLIGQTYNSQIRVYNIFRDLTNKSVVKDNVNINKIGKYNVECSVKYLFLDVKKTFNIEIVDKEVPSITLDGDIDSVVCPGKEYDEQGYSAYDNYDGDITNKVKIVKNSDNILYSVIDSSNNYFEIKRNVIYKDDKIPTITLNGNTTTYIYLGNNYYEPGYSASDNCDGDITDKVVVTNNVNTKKLGKYTIKYEITDSNNNYSYVEREVIVRHKVSSYGNGKIYLTFDDGSSHLTEQVLNILNEENVKATFFVVNVNNSVKRAYNSGHTIALHSNSHNYSYIYSSSDNYFNDLNAISNKVYNLIGVRSNIIRFPGGSSNTISKNYSVGIMSHLTNEVLNRGYIYFDWNIDSNDAGYDINNSDNIYYNVVNNLSHSKTNVVLMHDSYGHDATVRVLRDIIKYGKNYGYTFEAITKNTPVVVHGINN